MNAYNIFQNILQSINLPINEINNVSIEGQDPILPTPFVVGEAGAATLAAIGYLASEIWYLKYASCKAGIDFRNYTSLRFQGSRSAIFFAL